MTGTRSTRPWQPRDWIIGVIRAYRHWISPSFGANCRYLPTCSAFAIEVLEQHGLARGSGLAIKRIGRCHPFREGGHDPAPLRTDASPERAN